MATATRPQSRPGHARETRREQILDAARAVFAANGFQATTISDIERATGLTRGAIYYHFRGKEEIYVAVLTIGLRLLRAQLQEAVRSRDVDPREFIAQLVDVYCEFYRSHPDMFRIAQLYFFGRESRVDLDPALVDQINRLTAECLQILEDAIRRGVKRKVFAARDPFFEVILLWSTATNLVQLTEANPHPGFLRLPWGEMKAFLTQSIVDRLCTGATAVESGTA